jgi:hypothetical protein
MKNKRLCRKEKQITAFLFGVDNSCFVVLLTIKKRSDRLSRSPIFNA